MKRLRSWRRWTRWCWSSQRVYRSLQLPYSLNFRLPPASDLSKTAPPPLPSCQPRHPWGRDDCRPDQRNLCSWLRRRKCTWTFKGNESCETTKQLIISKMMMKQNMKKKSDCHCRDTSVTINTKKANDVRVPVLITRMGVSMLTAATNRSWIQWCNPSPQIAFDATIEETGLRNRTKLRSDVWKG